MCGRYQFTAEQSTEILQIIQDVQDKFGTQTAQSVRQGDITPGFKMPVLLGSDEGPTPELMVWGFQLKTLVFNAKVETALEKSTFKESTMFRHCVVPSTGFYEKDIDKRRHLFTMPNSPVLYMAGIFDVRGGVPRYCILTTEPNDSVRPIHNRMPLVLEQEQIKPWLYDMKRTEEFLNMTPPLLDEVLAEAQIGLW